MPKLKISWKKLKLYSRDKHDYNAIRKKNFSSPYPHPSAEGQVIEVGL